MVRTRKLLVVDDSPVARMMVQTLLRGCGYLLCEAQDGAQALELASKDTVDLIVMDVSMPKMDGLSALRALKSDPRTRDIPVVMLTAEGDVAETERCFQAGCDAYITKPINAATLKAQIEALFEKAAAP